MFQSTKEGICFRVKVIPKASRSDLVGIENDELKIRLAAVPEKGEANDALLRFAAELFGISLSRVVLVQGEKSRHKRLCVSGLTMEQMEAKVQERLEKKGK